jgi:hypothetical protein
VIAYLETGNAPSMLTARVAGQLVLLPVKQLQLDHGPRPNLNPVLVLRALSLQPVLQEKELV